MIEQILKGVSKLTASAEQVLPDVTVLKFTIVNACMAGDGGGWILADTGLGDTYDFILEKSQGRFGGVPPISIVLTHGHFDHVGSLKRLAEHWDVPVYAHELEIPYITGKKDYPPGDPDADEGMVAKMSPSFPNKSIDIGFRAVALPEDGSIPGCSDWKWIHTPGHTEGHISLFREKDKTLIAGDAFTTTKQESLSSVLTQAEQVKGPPAYFTTDWESARRSVERLKALEPDLAVVSHGNPMRGDELKRHLEYLVSNFNEAAVPDRGRYSGTAE
jgi:glyoxylase-like metal-dependent hydrolase (beta-lactamase superfamily II)